MNERTLRVLEYENIKQQVRECTSTSMGQDKADELYPCEGLSQVEQLQAATAEGEYVYRIKGGAPFGGIRDIRQSVTKARVGVMLDESQLLDIADTVAGSRRLRKFLLDLQEEAACLPILAGYAEVMIDGRRLEQPIRAAIDDAGHVLDSASSDLRRIRGDIRTARGRVRERLETMLRSADIQKMLQDPIVTVRNDRYCLPVKSEYRSAFNGMIHDQSSSGSTLFIEPASVVNLNNDIREFELKEKREIDKILLELTAIVGEHADELLQSALAIAEADFIIAKAVYARRIRANRPQINDEGLISLKRARHPLIAYEHAVPIDVTLGDQFNLLVITGPNTGGKTVTLKTIGLLAMMAMSGLQIPADEGSVISTFEAIFADIGDEQSIEQSLSTFSSHMTNIIAILERANDRSLILLDELGAGTDPAEGAALAMAILDFLVTRRTRTVATTHYSDLKAYAFENEFAMNASVEFDVESLRPTYRLLVGIPGKSNAFAISKRLGLREDIIQTAESKLDASDVQVESLIRRLEETQLDAERQRQQAEKLRSESQKQHEQLQIERLKWQEEQDKALLVADDKAAEIVRKATREADSILTELREMRSQQETVIKEHQLIEMRKRLDAAVPSTRRDRRAARKQTAEMEQLAVGDEVLVHTVNQKGTVSDVNEQAVTVQIGILKTKVRRDQVEKITNSSKGSNQQPTPKSVTIVKRADDQSPVQMELDLRGERVEAALAEVDKYLDRSILSGFSRVSIIHGKGTGQLRAAIQDFLRSHPQVKSYRYGVHGEGGDGVTIVSI